MTELAALNIRITGDSKDLAVAVATAQGDLNKLATASQATSKNMKVLQTGTVATGTGMASLSMKMRGASQQLSQVGQQTMATGNFVQALAIQLPDLGLAFGTVGAAAGLLAGIALPAIMGAFGATGSSAATFSEQIDALNESISALSEVTDLYSSEGLVNLKEKYGEVTIEVLRLLEAQRAQAQFQMEQDAAAAISALNDQYSMLAINLDQVDGYASRAAGKVGAIALELGITFEQARKLVASFQELDRASLADKPRILSEIRMQLQAAGITTGEWVNAINIAEDAIRQVNAEGAKAGGWLAAATTGAQAWATAMWDAASAAAAASQGYVTGTYTPGAMDAAARGALPGAGIKMSPSGAGLAATKSGGGGGGGSVTSSIQSELEAMQEGLLTQEQMQMESFARQQEILDQALAQRLISQEEYQNLMQQAQQTHDFAMTQSVNKGVSDTLSALGSLFQGSKKISAAIAVANSWLAFTEVLKDPAYVGRPLARIAAAGQALAAGLNAVRNIKSASAGGGGGSAGGAQSSAGQQSASPLQVSLNTYGFGDFMKTGDLRGLLTQLNKVAGDTGYKILVPA